MSGFEDVNHYFRKAARIMDLSSRVERLLVTPYREVKADPHQRGGAPALSARGGGRARGRAVPAPGQALQRMGLLNWKGFAVVTWAM